MKRDARRDHTGQPPRVPPEPVAELASAVLLVVILGVVGGVMWAVTTFLFHFSGGQVLMGPVVDRAALAATGLTLVIAAVARRLRSRAVAVKVAAFASVGLWALVMIVEWGLSFVLVSHGPG